MTRTPEVSLARATPADATLLANLLELYTHDLSDVFTHVELGPDGRYGYAKLSRYWSDPERNLAFVVRSAGRVAGFALATRGSPAADEPDVHDVAEFFVLRRYRRSGVGSSAARSLFAALPGSWTVRVSAGNASALAFWRSVVAGSARASVTELERPGAPYPWKVLYFESAATAP